MTKQTWDREKFKLSGEFKSAPLEQAYLQLSWPDIKTVTRYALLAMAFMGSAFFISDLLNVKAPRQLYLLLAIRLTAGILMVLSAEYIYSSKHYFKSYPYLLAFNQVVVAVGLCGLAVLRQMPPAYLGVNTILCTLFYYQFINNRFAVGLGAGAAAVPSFNGTAFHADRKRLQTQYGDFVGIDEIRISILVRHV